MPLGERREPRAGCGSGEVGGGGQAEVCQQEGPRRSGRVPAGALDGEVWTRARLTWQDSAQLQWALPSTGTALFTYHLRTETSPRLHLLREQLPTPPPLGEVKSQLVL